MKLINKILSVPNPSLAGEGGPCRSTDRHGRATKTLALLFLFTGFAAYAIASRARADVPPPVVKITASKFHFTPDHIMLKKGQPVTLQFTSTDRVHGFMIRPLKIDAEINPGAVTTVTVTPQAAGTFKAICDHYCGLGHGFMKMTVVVE